MASRVSDISEFPPKIWGHVLIQVGNNRMHLIPREKDRRVCNFLKVANEVISFLNYETNSDN